MFSVGALNIRAYWDGASWRSKAAIGRWSFLFFLFFSFLLLTMAPLAAFVDLEEALVCVNSGVSWARGQVAVLSNPKGEPLLQQVDEIPQRPAVWRTIEMCTCGCAYVSLGNVCAGYSVYWRQGKDQADSGWQVWDQYASEDLLPAHFLRGRLHGVGGYS